MTTSELCSGSSRRPNIPQELVVAIIDELCDDTPSLRSCSLVSSKFLPLAHRHLFSSFKYVPTHREKGYHPLIEHLRAPNGIHNYVQSLTLDDMFVTSGGKSQQAPLLPSDLWQILELLPHIQALTLSMWVSIDHWHHLSYPVYSRPLQMLKLKHIRSSPLFATSVDIHAILSMFSSISTLHLYSVIFSNSREVKAIKTSVRPTKLIADSCVSAEHILGPNCSVLWEELKFLEWKGADSGGPELQKALRPTLVDVHITLDMSYGPTIGSYHSLSFILF